MIRMIIGVCLLTLATGLQTTFAQESPEPVQQSTVTSEPTTQSPASTATPAAAQSPAGSTATAEPTTVAPTEPLPTSANTPLPSTPTPALPEEGGPPGGVISGHLFVDNDGSRSRTAGDTVAPLSTVLIQLVRDDGGPSDSHATFSDENTGRWEFRGLPDGLYRISWEPPIPPELYDETIPPTLAYDPVPGDGPDSPYPQVAYRMSREIEIRGANRVTGIDFGVPYRGPIAAPRALPSTGGGGGVGGDMGLIAAAIALVAGPALALAFGVRRRRNGRAAS